MRLLNTMQKIILRIMQIFCIFSFSAVTLLVCAQVFVRFALANVIDMSWSEELIRYLLCWLTFFGTAILYEQHGHIWVTNLVDAAPGSVKRLLLLISYLIQMVFFAAILIGTTQYLPTVATQTSAVLHIPLQYVYMIIPIVAVCTMAFCIRDIVLLMQGRGDLSA